VIARRGLATLALVAVLAATAEAASFALDDKQIADAVAAGESSVTREGVGDEWRQKNAAGHVLRVMTPFHRLAIAAREAAFRQDSLKPRDIRRVVKEQRDRLVLWLELRGPREDFAHFYTPRLMLGSREIEPTFSQNERTAARIADGAYLAQCVYAFPTRNLTGTSKVGLVVRDADGQTVTSFVIDLASMR
jgi:hypothetical protein